MTLERAFGCLDLRRSADAVCNQHHEKTIMASSSAAGAAAGGKQLNPQEIQVQFQRYRTELQNLAQKIGELESEMEEHA